MEQFIQENMKIIRNILGYNQGIMADKLGITRQYLGQLEKGNVELQRTVALAFMTVILHKVKDLDESSVAYKLMNVYLKEFQVGIARMVE